MQSTADGFLEDLRNRALLFDMFLESGFPYASNVARSTLSADAVLPEHRLTITKVVIESPGFWEVLASFNPLQQIREYLNDRHKRRQDRDFREAGEKERIQLENELLSVQIAEKENAVIKQRVEILRDLGFSEIEIRQFVWSQGGAPLSKLGRHQDSGLIAGAE